MGNSENNQARQRGRPPLNDGEVRSEVIRMRATKAEKSAYEKRGGNKWLRRELAKKS